MSDLSDWRKMQDGYRAPADCHIAPAAANERKAFMTALRIMLTSDSWGAAYGAVCEDYPEMTELVKDYKARVCCGPQKEAVQELVEAAEKSQQLAYRLLWIAFAWNDHNFKPAHEEAKETCVKCGISTLTEADEFLLKMDAALARVTEGEKK
jgi:hypothetical protein